MTVPVATSQRCALCDVPKPAAVGDHKRRGGHTPAREPVWAACYVSHVRPKEPCATCGQLARIARRLDDGRAQCPACYAATGVIRCARWGARKRMGGRRLEDGQALCVNRYIRERKQAASEVRAS